MEQGRVFAFQSQPGSSAWCATGRVERGAVAVPMGRGGLCGDGNVCLKPGRADCREECRAGSSDRGETVHRCIDLLKRNISFVIRNRPSSLQPEMGLLDCRDFSCPPLGGEENGHGGAPGDFYQVCSFGVFSKKPHLKDGHGRCGTREHCKNAPAEAFKPAEAYASARLLADSRPSRPLSMSKVTA